MGERREAKAPPSPTQVLSDWKNRDGKYHMH